MAKIKSFLILFFSNLLFFGCASYPNIDNKIEIANQQCQNEISKLHKIDIKKSDLRFGFLYNQTCIALNACSLNSGIKDNIWRDKVVTHFVDAYINQTNNWPQIENKCHKISKFMPARSLFCQKNMALYHIRYDLLKSLNYSGCGSDEDWKIMEKIIVQCVKQAQYTPLIANYVRYKLIKEREKIRNICLKP